MTYFAQFPKLQYDIKGDGNVNVIPDIFRRIKLKNKIRDNLVILDKYAEGASVFFDIFIRIHSIYVRRCFLLYICIERVAIFNPF